MQKSITFPFTGAALVLLACSVSPGMAQVNDAWVVFQDSLTGAECGVINAANAELLTLYDSGEVVVISGADVLLGDLFVNVYDEVFYQDEPAGVIAFFDDADGLPAVFWTSLTGTLMQIDTLTGAPSDSQQYPDQITGTGCDACELVDESIFCEEQDGDEDDPAPPSTLDILQGKCGDGSGDAVAAGIILLPVVARSTRRQRRGRDR